MTTNVIEEEKVPVLLQDVQILEDHVRVMVTGGIEKIISLEDFRNILNSSLGAAEDTKMDGFSLPSNVFYFGKSGAQIQLNCYYQSRVSTIKYLAKKMDIVVPNLIISHVLNKAGDQTWTAGRTKYFCTDLSVGRLPKEFISSIDARKHIFLSPLSNTYAEGNMCYGNNAMPMKFPDNNLRGLDWYYQYLFESPFNDDLGIGALNERMSVPEWYAHLAAVAKEGKEFPYAKLRGFSAG